MGDPFLDDQNISTEDVVFTQADGELRKLAWSLNGKAWAAPMSIDDYVAREIHLSQQALSKDGHCIYWVLSHKDDPTHIVASCESVEKTVLIAGHGTGINDGFIEAKAYAIASVYTNPKYRRLGMAAYMMEKLQEHMDADSECSALYSDIGKIYYANLGWNVFPSDQATIYLESEDFKLPEHPATRYLTEDELEPLCDKDVAAVKAKFQTLAADHQKTHVAFLPSYPQIAWQLAREQFMAGVLHKREIKYRGAITNSGKSWVYWDHDWREGKLKIMRLVTLDHDPETGLKILEENKIVEVLELLRAAAAEAIEWNLKKVLIWNPSGTVTRGTKAFHNYHEEDVDVIWDERYEGSIPSFRWKEGKSTDNTVWDFNEYYAWC